MISQTSVVPQLQMDKARFKPGSKPVSSTLKTALDGFIAITFFTSVVGFSGWMFYSFVWRVATLGESQIANWLSGPF